MNSLGVEGKVYQKYMWIYCTSPFLGGIIASLFMRFVHNPNLGIIINDPYQHDAKTLDERLSIVNSQEEIIELSESARDYDYDPRTRGRG